MRLKLLRPWWRRSRRSGAAEGESIAGSPESLREIGALVRRRREDLGLSLRDLAIETRITTSVIEALERGWRDRLPERTYLASMLPQLEERLELPTGSLDPALPPRAPALRLDASGRGLRRFTPGTIDVLTTWQGSVVYALAIGLSLMALNRQQQDLALRNSQTLEPVQADLRGLNRLKTASSPTDPVVRALRPLEQATQRRPEEWLNAGGGLRPSGIGVLQLRLKQNRRLRLFSGGGDRLQMDVKAGAMTLQLQAPLELVITPPPSDDDRVLWDGKPLLAVPNRQGVYRVDSSKPEAPARERPQTAPRSP